MTQQGVWGLVQIQAKAQGIVGIHFDECQHIFPKEGRVERGKILNSFKSLLKDLEWPMMLVLSGVDELAGHIKSDDQLDELLDDVVFSEFDVNRSGDIEELNTLCHAYAEMVGLDFSDLASVDFFQRLALACAGRWGLMIELLINALVVAVLDGSDAIRADHFCRAFTKGTRYRPGISPFSIRDFEKHFERRKLAQLWDERQKVCKSG